MENVYKYLYPVLPPTQLISPSLFTCKRYLGTYNMMPTQKTKLSNNQLLAIPFNFGLFCSATADAGSNQPPCLGDPLAAFSRACNSGGDSGDLNDDGNKGDGGDTNNSSHRAADNNGEDSRRRQKKSVDEDVWRWTFESK